MTEITASLIKDLRETTGAGMMDCKKALVETAGNLEEATVWLRKKGLMAAGKKAGRVAAEGLVGVAVQGTRGAVVEVNAETDFVARNETFQGFVTAATGAALEGGVGTTPESLATLPYPGTSGTVQEALTGMIATIGENMALRRVEVVSVAQGLVVPYVHNALGANRGKIGVLVALESAAESSQLQALGKHLAMHIAATRPEALTVADLNPATVARERDIATDQAKTTGKPEAIIAKMVEGRLKKFYDESVLMEQISALDGATRIADVVAQAAKDAGTPIRVTRFVRYQVGEGIEKTQGPDFATEVASLAR